jgi:hypothetical protein
VAQAMTPTDPDQRKPRSMVAPSQLLKRAKSALAANNDAMSLMHLLLIALVSGLAAGVTLWLLVR